MVNDDFDDFDDGTEGELCPTCGSTHTWYAEGFGFWKCEDCSGVWGYEADDPDYDEAETVPLDVVVYQFAQCLRAVVDQLMVTRIHADPAKASQIQAAHAHLVEAIAALETESTLLPDPAPVADLWQHHNTQN